MAYPRKISDQVAYWQQQIEVSQRFLEPRIEAGKVLAREFYADAATDREQEQLEFGGDSQDITQRTKAGLVYGWIDQSIANMLDRDPVFQCLPETKEAATPLRPGDPNSLTLASAAARIVNYRYRETSQIRVDERVLQDAFLFPYGAVKIGYEDDMEERAQDILDLDGVELVVDSPDEENMFLVIGQETRVTAEQDHWTHMEAHKQLRDQELEKMEYGTDRAEEIRAGIDQHIDWHKAFHWRPAPGADTGIKRQSPWAVRWDPGLFLTDRLCMEGVRDARWVAFGWNLPIDEVKSDPDYSNTGDLEPFRDDYAPEKPQWAGSTDASDGFDMIRGWEIWVRNLPVGRGRFENRLITVAEGHDKFLRNEKEWPYEHLDDFPADTLVFQPGLDSWFYKSPLQMGGADTMQALVNEILDSYLSVVRKQKNVWLVDPAAGLDENVLTDIMDAPDGSVVQVPGLMEAKGNPVVPLPFVDVPPEKGDLVKIIQSMFDRSMGTPQPIALPQSDTATEASIMEKRNTSRENRRSGLLSSFQVRKARKMWQLDTQFMPARDFLIDDTGLAFVSITPEMAKGEYWFRMDVSSQAAAANVERKQWLDLLNLFAGLTPLMIKTFKLPPNLPELARRLLVRGFNEKNVEEILPMLKQASEIVRQGWEWTPPEEGQEGQKGGAPSGSSGGLQPGAGVKGASQKRTPEEEAVLEGRNRQQGVGPLEPELFNRNVHEGGRGEGASERA